MKANAQKGRKHPFKFILIVCSAIFAIWLAFSTLKTSSFAKSFRGGFIAAASDFSQAYTYTSGSNTYYLLFASNVNVVCLTSSKSGNAGLTTYQGASLTDGLDSVFYYSSGTCHRNFKYQDFSNDSILLVTETSGGSLPEVHQFEKTDLETAKTALDEMRAIYDVSKP